MSQTARTYRIDFPWRRPPIDISLVQTNNEASDDVMFRGRIELVVRYDNPNTPPGQVSTQRYVYKQAFEHRFGRNDFLMRVEDFQLPPCLRRNGLGTLLWSLMIRALPERMQGRTTLTGTLTSVDAVIEETDRDGHVRLTYAGGTAEPVRVPNVERRNDFWKRMLSPDGLKFTCDDHGNGRFEGRLVDPALHPSYAAALVVQSIAAPA